MAMEHGAVPPLGRAHPGDPHRPRVHGGVAMEGEEEHGHHEKKPVLKKVKEKVKKIKDTIKKKHGHGHGHGHGHDVVHDHGHDHVAHDQDTSEEEDGYEEDDDDVDEGGGESAVHPEVHGGATSASLLFPYGKKFDSSVPLVPDGGDNVTQELFHGEPTVIAEHGARTGGADAAGAAEHIGDLEKTPLKEVVGGLEEDPAAPKSATSGQLRGGEVVGESPVIRSFHAMAISEQPPAPTSSAVGPQETKERNAAAKEEEERTQSYTEKLSSATKATAATLSEKVAQAGATVKEKVQGTATALTGDETQSYAGKISSTAKEAASTVYSKVAEAGTAVMEKVHQGPPTSEGADASTTKQPGKGVTGHPTERLKPGDDQERAPSMVISDTLTMRRKKKAEEEAPADTEVSDTGGGQGGGVVGTIKGAVASLFSGGSSPHSSPTSEAERKS